MESFELEIMKRMNQNQRLMFQTEFNAVRKSETTGLVLALFLGGVGAHHFYLGNVKLGIVYALLCWTFIPVIVGFLECFFMSDRVKEWNEQKAYAIAGQVRLLNRSEELAS